jgi:hypothetical protein
VAGRLAMLEAAFDAATTGWVLSGSLDGWGDPLIPRFEHVVFLSAPTELRLARLAKRERERYGAAGIAPGGAQHAQHLDFMAFAAAYDSGEFPGVLSGRHRARHEAWLAALPVTPIALDGALPTDALVQAVLARV